MKTIALLLTIPILLLMPVLSAKALSFNNDVFFQLYRQDFDPSNNLINSKFEDLAISQSLSITEQSKIAGVEENTSYPEITEESMNIWMKDTATAAPYFVPEPASLILLGSGLLILAEMNRRWKKANSSIKV